MMRPRIWKEEQRQVDKATAETERRVETLDALAVMEKRALAAEVILEQVREWNRADMFDGDDFETLDGILDQAPRDALAAHDKTVRATALRDAADVVERMKSYEQELIDPVAFLRARADQEEAKHDG